MKVKLAEFENAVARYLDAALCEPVEISTEERNRLVNRAGSTGGHLV
jgi:hypothetical protein